VSAGKKEIAIHEAGHAIAAAELDVVFDDISIVTCAGIAGRVGVDGDQRFDVPPGVDPHSSENEEAFLAWAEKHAVIDYAGHAAIVTLLGIGDMSQRSGCEHGAHSDFRKASDRLGHDRHRMQNAKTKAVQIVSDRAADIRTIANALVEHGHLDAQQIHRILYGVPVTASLEG
jgi:hypothetical protein